MRLDLLDLAKRDLIEGYRFYEFQGKGLGDYFLINVYADIESLKFFGGIHRRIYKKYHRALSKRFPFAIYYTVEGETVKVQSIVDCRREPEWIRQHLKNL